MQKNSDPNLPRSPGDKAEDTSASRPGEDMSVSDRGDGSLQGSGQSSHGSGQPPLGQPPLGRAKRWLRHHAPQLRWLAIGFLGGALVFGLRSANNSDDGARRGHDATHAGHDSGPSPASAEDVIWTCSMHPQIRMSEPGSCPICGMDLIPVNGASSEETQGSSATEVRLSERAQRLAQLRTTLVHRRKDSAAAVRLLGRIEPNETTLKTVTAWTGGRIDRLFVNTTGETVKGGQIIATLYSPEIFTAHQDLISAAAQVQRLSAGAESSQRAAAAALAAARQRLNLLGVPDGELARMEKEKKPTTAVAIRTPFGGTVMERFATEGTYVTTGARLYSIAKLTSLWIQLDAYESDLPLLSVNQSVQVEVEAYPGEEFDGTVTFIDPMLDPQKRTARVRVEVDNADGRLRPGMFAQAIVTAETGKGDNAPLVIPASAPLFTGQRAIVYVELPGPNGSTYEARTVRLGVRLGNLYPVVAGLSEGDRIVTRGAFVLDADLQIHGGDSMMSSPDDTQPSRWDTAIEVPQAALQTLAPVVEDYLALQRALAADDLAQARGAASTLVAALKKTRFVASPRATKAWTHFSAMLNEHAQHVAQANSLEEARKSFELLSGNIVMMLRVLGNPLEKALVQAYCPMAAGSEGASWVQEGEALNNSYFGASMLDCGDVTALVQPGAHLPSPGAKPTGTPRSAPAEGHKH